MNTPYPGRGEAMALLDDAYSWLRFAHVLGVLVFVLAHGAPAAVSFRLRREQDLERIAALLDVSAASYVAMVIGFLWLLATGLTLGFIGPWWTMAWFWTALVLLFVVAGVMTPLAAIPYNKARKALGLVAPMRRGEVTAPSAPPSPQETGGSLRRRIPGPTRSSGSVALPSSCG